MVNKTIKNNKNILLVNYKVFLLILLLAPLYLFNSKYIKLAGSFAIVSILMLPLLNAMSKLDRIKMNKMWFWYLMFLSYNILMLVRTPTRKGFYSFALKVTLVFFVLIFSTIKIDKYILRRIFQLGKLICTLLMIPAIFIALEGGRAALFKFDRYFSPVIYQMLFPCTFFYVADSKYKLPKILFFTFIFLRMVNRTSAIVMLIIYISYLLLKRFRDSKQMYKLIFIVVFLSLVSFTYMYVQLQYTELGATINTIFYKYTGGNFFSGRNIIWERIFEYVKMAPIFGHGIDHNVLKMSEINMSVHNTYVHIWLQGGMIEVFIFFMFIFSIWNTYFEHLENDIVLTSAAYLIGILIFANFKLTLIGNSVVTAIFSWIVLGIGLMASNNSVRLDSQCN